MLEEEIYGENSPIWEADFTMPASDGAQLGHQTGEAGAQSVRKSYFLLLCPLKTYLFFFLKYIFYRVLNFSAALNSATEKHRRMSL